LYIIVTNFYFFYYYIIYFLFTNRALPHTQTAMFLDE
jgi:hypothetical protein